MSTMMIGFWIDPRNAIPILWLSQQSPCLLRVAVYCFSCLFLLLNLVRVAYCFSDGHWWASTTWWGRWWLAFEISRPDSNTTTSCFWRNLKLLSFVLYGQSTRFHCNTAFLFILEHNTTSTSYGLVLDISYFILYQERHVFLFMQCIYIYYLYIYV